MKLKLKVLFSTSYLHDRLKVISSLAFYKNNLSQGNSYATLPNIYTKFVICSLHEDSLKVLILCFGFIFCNNYLFLRTFSVEQQLVYSTLVWKIVGSILARIKPKIIREDSLFTTPELKLLFSILHIILLSGISHKVYFKVLYMYSQMFRNLYCLLIQTKNIDDLYLYSLFCKCNHL